MLSRRSPTDGGHRGAHGAFVGDQEAMDFSTIARPQRQSGGAGLCLPVHMGSFPPPGDGAGKFGARSAPARVCAERSLYRGWLHLPGILSSSRFYDGKLLRLSRRPSAIRPIGGRVPGGVPATIPDFQEDCAPPLRMSIGGGRGLLRARPMCGFDTVIGDVKQPSLLAPGELPDRAGREA